MEENWVLKVYTKCKMPYRLYRLLNNEDTRYVRNYSYNTYAEKPKKIIKKLQKAGIKYDCYRMDYERARNYRQIFLSNTSGPYRCRYCNRRLSEDKLYVDHIVPVGRAQKMSAARMLLSIRKCTSVNDVKNLAPACKKCNLKKSDKMGLWVVRGWLGKYKLYWIILRFTEVLLLIGCVYVAIKYMTGTEDYFFISNFFSHLINSLK